MIMIKHQCLHAISIQGNMDTDLDKKPAIDLGTLVSNHSEGMKKAS